MVHEVLGLILQLTQERGHLFVQHWVVFGDCAVLILLMKNASVFLPYGVWLHHREAPVEVHPSQVGVRSEYDLAKAQGDSTSL